VGDNKGSQAGESGDENCELHFDNRIDLEGDMEDLLERVLIVMFRAKIVDLVVDGD
jgi:hypothetical protein